MLIFKATQDKFIDEVEGNMMVHGENFTRWPIEEIEELRRLADAEDLEDLAMDKMVWKLQHRIDMTDAKATGEFVIDCYRETIEEEIEEAIEIINKPPSDHDIASDLGDSMRDSELC